MFLTRPLLVALPPPPLPAQLYIVFVLLCFFEYFVRFSINLVSFPMVTVISHFSTISFINKCNVVSDKILRAHCIGKVQLGQQYKVFRLFVNY